MTVVNRLRQVSLGVHAGVAYTTVPSTLRTILLTDDGASLLARGREKIDRNYDVVDGRRLPHARGAQSIGEVSLPMEFRGLSANDGSAVADWEALLEQGDILSCFFGDTAVATSGAATTCSGSAGTTLTVASGTGIVNGRWIAFSTTDGFFIRRVVSGGTTTTLTLNLAFTGTPSGTVFRLPSYSVDTAMTIHPHAFLRRRDVEVTSEFFGCACNSLNLVVPNTGLVTMTSSWMPTTINTPEAHTAPTFAAPVAGPPVGNDGARVSIGGVEFFAEEINVTLQNGMQPRGTGSRANGLFGHVATDKHEVMIQMVLRLASDGSFPELRRASGTPDMRDLLGVKDALGVLNGTRSVQVQVGSAVTRAMAMWLPAADIHGVTQLQGAYPAVAVTAYANASSGVPPFELAVA